MKDTLDNLWPEYYDGKAPMKYGDVSVLPKYGRMLPDLVFHIHPNDAKIQFSHTPFGNIVPDGELSWMEGKFWVDRENPEIKYFHPKVYKPEHVLVRVEWTKDNETHGYEWDVFSRLAIHSKQSVSKTGKYGINWYIFTKDFLWKDPATIAAIEEEFGKLPIVEPEYIIED